MSEFWTTGIVYVLILTVTMRTVNSICLISGLSEFWKTLFN